jgi:polysaccharide biosynthesis transport protein
VDIQNNEFNEVESQSFHDFVRVIRYYFPTVISIFSVCLLVGLIYASLAINIYKSSTQLKISKPHGNILDAPTLNMDFEDIKNDRFIATEILQLKSKNFRLRVADALIDSCKNRNNLSDLYLLLKKPAHKTNGALRLRTKDEIADMLGKEIVIEQAKGVDVVQITMESPSSYEAYLVANCYKNNYQDISQEVNRNQLTLTKEFLLKQKDEKLLALNQAENMLRTYQEAKGFVSLDDQAKTVIAQISQIEAQLNLATIDLLASNNTVKQLEDELGKSDPQLVRYLENIVSEEYIKNAQTEIAKLQLLKDIAQIDTTFEHYDARVDKNTTSKISQLNDKIRERISGIKNVLGQKDVSEIKGLSQKLLDEKLRNQSLKTNVSELTRIYRLYESKFNALPKASIEFADLKRKQESLEKLYTLVDGRYQEALINEQSQPGYVSVIDDPEVSKRPFKPNRLMIILIGFAAGLALGAAYALIRNFFDQTIKSPEDIEKKKINLISWIPPISNLKSSPEDEEFTVFHYPKSSASEAFKVLRTRLQFSKLNEKKTKSILITSSVPGEGKTTIAANLAGSFALSDLKTVIVDCDFRKPRIHSFFKESRSPGLVDYLFDNCELKDIIRPTKLSNLFYIPCGTIPPNPSEILHSEKIKEMFGKLNETFDFIIVDSPPVLAVTDAELLAMLIDVTVLVSLAGVTLIPMLERVVDQFTKESVNFVGVVLNNFDVESNYGAYYKYYYYYYGRQGSSKKNIKNRIMDNFSKRKSE